MIYRLGHQVAGAGLDEHMQRAGDWVGAQSMGRFGS